MLRREILREADLLMLHQRGEWVDKNNRQKAIELAGKDSFSLDAEAPQDFGIIESISPVFLLDKEKKPSTQAPFLENPELLSHKGRSNIGGIPQLKNFDPKKGLEERLTDGKQLHDIFCAKEQVGIIKKASDEAFYKKTSYMFEDKQSFAFILTTSEPLNLKRIVQLGGERSSFYLSMEEVDRDFRDFLNLKNRENFLLSPSYIKGNLTTLCTLGVTKESAYKTLLGPRGKKSRECLLYERGSLFIEPKDALFEALAIPNLQKIGLNIIHKGEKQNEN